DQIVAGTAPQRSGGKFLVPVRDNQRRNVKVADRDFLKNRERVDPWMTVLDEEDVERRVQRPVLCQMERSATIRQRFDNIDRPAGPSETLPRQRGIADINQTQSPGRCRRGGNGHAHGRIGQILAPNRGSEVRAIPGIFMHPLLIGLTQPTLQVGRRVQGRSAVCPGRWPMPADGSSRGPWYARWALITLCY